MSNNNMNGLNLFNGLAGTSFFGMDDNNQAMMQSASTMLDIYKAYYDYNLNDEVLTDYVTQSFYQSMYLQRKKLRNNGIVMHIESQKTGRITKDNFINFNVPVFTQQIKEEKTIIKNGVAINKKARKMVAVSTVIRGNGKTENVQCPRCGHNGTVESYIDGCDYCGAKFKVEDFKDKISSFRIEKNSRTEATKIFAKFGLSLLIMISILFVAAIGSLVAMLLNGGYGNGVSFMLLIGGFKAIPWLTISIIVLGVLFCVVWTLLLMNFYKRIDKSSALTEVKSLYANFVPEKFAEDLEYKLRNIHFAERPEEINVFSKCDLSEAISRYKNVIGCELLKIKILEMEKLTDQLQLKVRARLKLTICEGKTVKEKDEIVSLIVSYKDAVLAKDVKDIEMHICKSCGSTINMLNGGICEQCGNRINYSNYSYMIESYYSNYKEMIPNTLTKFGNEKCVSLNQKIKIALFGVITGIVVLFCGAMFLSCGNLIRLIANSSEIEVAVYNEFDGIKKLDDYSNSFNQTDFTKHKMAYVYTYNYEENLKSELDDYISYLVNSEGFKYHKKNSNEIEIYRDSAVGYKANLDTFIDITFTIHNYNNTLEVEFAVSDYELERKLNDDNSY